MRNMDCVIIGAGIAGITAGIYLKRSNKSAIVLDKGAPGGKLNNIHKIDNYPGFAGISGPDLAMNLYSQASSLGVEIGYGSVQEVRKEGVLFHVQTDTEEYVSKTVIVATGVENKKLGIPGEKLFLGKGVSYCATCDGNFFKGQKVAVYGHKDFAVEDALYLSSICSHVYLIHSLPFEATEEHLAEAESLPNIEFVPGEVRFIEGDEKVERVTLDDNSSLDVSALFQLTGEKSSTEFLSSLGVASNKGFLIVDASQATSVPGLFACGDVVDKKLRQLINAAGEAAVAATSAISYIRSVSE